MIFFNEQLLQRLTKKFRNEQRVFFLQRATSAMSNERILQRVTSEFLQRLSDFLQQATSATSKE